MPLPQVAIPSSSSAGARLVATDGRALPYRGAALAVDAQGGLARVHLRQVFENPYDEPLRLHYSLPLPVDAAVAGFAFELGDRRVVGEVDTRRKARERFEEALVEGRSAALLQEERSSLFTQELGNVPPRSRIVCEIQLDQRLAWRADGAWEWRFPTVVGPRYLGQQGRVSDAEAVTVDVDASGTAPRATLRLLVRDALTGPATSPSHAVVAVADGRGLELSLAAEDGAALDRDLVVRWPVAAPSPGLSLDRARPAADRPHAAWAHGLLTIVPPAPAWQGAAVRRDLVVLLDTSGSMHGEPIAQAKAVTVALIESLGEQDSLQLVEFSSRPRPWRSGPVAMTEQARREALAWVRGLQAGGGTEMKDGILAALACLRDEAQRQVVLITDGLIGFEREIVAAIADGLPRGSRVHALGIGSAVNRTLTGGVARAGGGVEAIVGLGEAADAAAAQLVAATEKPLVVDLELSGPALVEAAHHRLPDLYGGRPVRLALRLDPAGGRLVLRGHGAAGPWEQVIDVPPTLAGSGSPAVVTLVGRERVEELELRAARGQQVDAAIEEIGLAYQVATRRTSWVAISQEATVDATAPTRRETVPQALPQGMSVEGLGLRAAAPALAMPGALPMMQAAAPAGPSLRARSEAPKRKAARLGGIVHSLRDAVFGSDEPMDADEESSALELPFEAAGAAPPPAPAAPPRKAEEVAEREVDAFRSTVLRASLLLRGGRVVLHKDGRLVVEVELDQGIEWKAPLTAELHFEDGSVRVVRLDRSRSTRAGALPAGATLRLVLELDALPARLGLVELGDLRIHVAR